MATVKKKSKPRQKTASPTSEAEKEFNRVIVQMFGNYHLKDIEYYLWNWMEAAITKDHSPFDSGKERGNLLFFYKNLLELFEATSLIHDRLQKGKR